MSIHKKEAVEHTSKEDRMIDEQDMQTEAKPYRRARNTIYVYSESQCNITRAKMHYHPKERVNR
jgi:hypothetical protein